MTAVDTSILVRAHRHDLPQHDQALERLRSLAEGALPWHLPVFCFGEFVRVVTHSRIFERPSTLEEATGALRGLLASPVLGILSPGPRYPELFDRALKAGDARGNLAFDAQIVALCWEQGIQEILTLDRDFQRFPKLRVLALEDS